MKARVCIVAVKRGKRWETYNIGGLREKLRIVLFLVAFHPYYPTIVQHAYGYSISGKGIVLGYYMIMFREIKLADFPPEIADYDPEIKERKISAVHIRYIAIDERYQHNKIGTFTIQTIIKSVKMLAVNWPIRVITIDAREDLVTWYEKLGFRKMITNTLGQDGVTVSMFFDCMQQKDEFMKYMNSIYE